MTSVVKDTTFIVIPAFNEERAIGAVVAELKALWPHVIVVDDGSRDATASVARPERRDGASPRRQSRPGCGIADRITHALRRGAQIVVTFDSDGQHRAEDVATLVAPIEEGARRCRPRLPLPRYHGEHAGDASASCFAPRPLHAHHVRRPRDGRAQRTARILARGGVAIEIRLDRMAHASEIVDQVAVHGARCVEVPVHVRYTDYSKRKGQTGLGAFRVLLDYLWGRWLR